MSREATEPQGKSLKEEIEKYNQNHDNQSQLKKFAKSLNAFQVGGDKTAIQTQYSELITKYRTYEDFEVLYKFMRVNLPETLRPMPNAKDLQQKLDDILSLGDLRPKSWGADSHALPSEPITDLTLNSKVDGNDQRDQPSVQRAVDTPVEPQVNTVETSQQATDAKTDPWYKRAFQWVKTKILGISLDQKTHGEITVSDNQFTTSPESYVQGTSTRNTGLLDKIKGMFAGITKWLSDFSGSAVEILDKAQTDLISGRGASKSKKSDSLNIISAPEQEQTYSIRNNGGTMRQRRDSDSSLTK